MDQQRCKGCGQEFPATTEFFFTAKNKKSGLYGKCKRCHLAAIKAWTEAHPEERRKANQNWRDANREKEQERWRQQRAKDPEAARRRVKESYKRHEQERKDARKLYVARNQEAIRIKRREARENWTLPQYLRDKETRARRQAKKRGCVHEELDYVAILARDQSTCYLCLKTVERADLTFDHIQPLAEGGSHTAANVRVAHYDCNRFKNRRGINWVIEQLNNARSTLLQGFHE